MILYDNINEHYTVLYELKYHTSSFNRALFLNYNIHITFVHTNRAEPPRAHNRGLLAYTHVHVPACIHKIGTKPDPTSPAPSPSKYIHADRLHTLTHVLSHPYFYFLLIVSRTIYIAASIPTRLTHPSLDTCGPLLLEVLIIRGSASS